jgi:hypothetical protein
LPPRICPHALANVCTYHHALANQHASLATVIGVWFTENIFGQKPLVTVSACPDCNYLNTVYFGDLFNVATDGIIPGGPPTDQVAVTCSNCKAPLIADRSKMVISTTVPKKAAA